MKSHPIIALCFAILVFISATTPAALINNGGGLIYDDVLDITWSQPWEQPVGTVTWHSASFWASSLSLGGVNNWRLPYISVAAGEGPFAGTPVNCTTASELACRDNELGYMFYHNLSGSFATPILESGDPDLALFPTLTTNNFWSSTEKDIDIAWIFDFRFGFQQTSGKDDPFERAWAVHDGNIGAVTIPAALWLFSSGLGGLFCISRKKKYA
jgi:hypothetical protein